MKNSRTAAHMERAHLHHSREPGGAGAPSWSAAEPGCRQHPRKKALLPIPKENATSV